MNQQPTPQQQAQYQQEMARRQQQAYYQQVMAQRQQQAYYQQLAQQNQKKKSKAGYVLKPLLFMLVIFVSAFGGYYVGTTQDSSYTSSVIANATGATKVVPPLDGEWVYDVEASFDDDSYKATATIIIDGDEGVMTISSESDTDDFDSDISDIGSEFDIDKEEKIFTFYDGTDDMHYKQYGNKLSVTYNGQTMLFKKKSN